MNRRWLFATLTLLLAASAGASPLSWTNAGGDNIWQDGERPFAADLNAIKTAHNDTDSRVTTLEAVDNITAAEATANVKTWFLTPTAANFKAALTGSGGTGTGAAVFAVSPIIVTPNLGTPTVLHLNSADLLPYTAITGMGAGVPAWLNDPSSANFLATLSTKTGTGLAVFADGNTQDKPTFTSKINVPHVAADPAAPATGDMAVFTNASAIGSCNHTGAALTLCYYNGAAWVALGDGGAGGVSALDDLTDVVMAGPADKNVLVYDGGTSKWVKGTIDLSSAAAVGATGSLPVSQLDAGKAADGNHFWAGDGTWKVPPGSGTVVPTGTMAADEVTCFSDASGNIVKGCASGTKINSTGLTIPAGATGQALTLAEATGTGNGTWQLIAGNLPNSATTCTIDTNGKIPAACLSAGATGLAVADINTSEELWDIVSQTTPRTGLRGGALVFSDSPTFTGVPIVPTTAGNVNTAQAASMASAHAVVAYDVSAPPANCASWKDPTGGLAGQLPFTWNFWRPGLPIHLTEIWCRSDNGDTTVMLQKQDGAPVDMFGSVLTCTNNGATKTGAQFQAGEDAIGVTDYINVIQTGVGETSLLLCAKYDIDSTP